MLILFCITNFSYFIDQIRRPDSISLPTRLNQKNEFDEEVFFCSNIVSVSTLIWLSFFRLQWFVRNNDEGSSERDLGEVKFEADLSFASKNYERARNLYAEILTRSKGMGSIRDVLEGLARCCLQTNRLEEALRWAIKLVRPFLICLVWTVPLLNSPNNPNWNYFESL